MSSVDFGTEAAVEGLVDVKHVLNSRIKAASFATSGVTGIETVSSGEGSKPG